MIKIANAPCSWGVLEFDLQGEAPDYVRVLNEIKETGYVGTELGDWGFMPTEPNELAEELAKRNLSMVGAFVPVYLKDSFAHNEGIEVAIKTATLMKEAGFDNSFIVLADDNCKDELRTKNAGRISEDLYLSDDEVENLLSLTDPNLIGLVLDMGHYMFGGGDPLEILKKHKERIWHIHFKDCDKNVAKASKENKWDYFESVRNGVFCELGKGAVDFQSIVNQLNTMNFDGWIVVEQDVLPGMGKPKECALNNRNFIKSLGL